MTPGDLVEAKPKPGAGGWRRGVLVEAGDRACVVRIGGAVLTVRRSRVREIARTAFVPRGRVPLAVADLERRTSTTSGTPRSTPKPRAPSRSRSYLNYVREKPCCACGAPGPSDPDHFGPRGVGQRTDDYRTVPVCRRCHDERHATGAVRGLSTAATRELYLRTQVDLLVGWTLAREAGSGVRSMSKLKGRRTT